MDAEISMVLKPLRPSRDAASSFFCYLFDVSKFLKFPSFLHFEKIIQYFSGPATVSLAANTPLPTIMHSMQRTAGNPGSENCIEKSLANSIAFSAVGKTEAKYDL